MLKRERFTTFFFNFLLIYIVMQPILDLIAGINNNYNNPLIKLNLIFRFLFLFISILYLLFFCKTKYKKYNMIYLIITAIYFMLFSISAYTKSNNLLFEELKQLLQYFYFPISLITIFNLNDISTSVSSFTFLTTKTPSVKWYSWPFIKILSIFLR